MSDSDSTLTSTVADVYLVWSAPGELIGVYANADAAAAEAEAERRERAAFGHPGAARLVRIRRVQPRTTPLDRPADQRALPLDCSAEGPQQLALWTQPNLSIREEHDIDRVDRAPSTLSQQGPP